MGVFFLSLLICLKFKSIFFEDCNEFENYCDFVSWRCESQISIYMRCSWAHWVAWHQTDIFTDILLSETRHPTLLVKISCYTLMWGCGQSHSQKFFKVSKFSKEAGLFEPKPPLPATFLVSVTNQRLKRACW